MTKPKTKKPKLPACKCGEKKKFFVRETRRTEGHFAWTSKDGLVFHPGHHTADLDFDAIVCQTCLAEIEGVDCFDWAD